MVQLLEDVCTIRGLSSINLDRLKQQRQFIDANQRLVYIDIFNRIEKSSRSMKAFIELNKVKISNIDKHSIVVDTFNQFHRNFNVSILMVVCLTHLIVF